MINKGLAYALSVPVGMGLGLLLYHDNTNYNPNNVIDNQRQVYSHEKDKIQKNERVRESKLEARK